MKFAVIVVDMLEDNFKGPVDHPVIKQFRSIIPNVRLLLKEARKLDGLVVFACDSYFREDFLFKGNMPPHALRGTPGADIIDDLTVCPGDIVLPKRRLSAFFKTDLDITLRTLGINTIAVAGLTTEACVLATAVDGLCNDFYSVILSDCSASRSHEIHEAIISIYSRFPTYPTLRVRTADAFFVEVKEGGIREGNKQKRGKGETAYG
ncbi:MAG: cysteine hydrolase [Deltaproteobacteria bacterium]|nr:cysteine hydrolase [Deltaproteobacteria bacterium]